MAAPLLIPGLGHVAERYDALLCDIWGVVHDGRVPFARGCEALARFKREQGPVVLVSNSPRPSPDVALQLDALNVPREAWSAIVTSGDATREELLARAPGPAWALGPMRDAPLYEGTGVKFAEVPEEAAFVSCTGLFDDEIETPDDFRDRLKVCVDRGLTMVCANPDRVVQRGGKTIYCAGSLADVYEDFGGEVVMVGKPYAPIYRLAYAEVERRLGRPPDHARLLALGDGPRTDLAGASSEGLDVLFTAATGIHGAEVTDVSGALSMERVEAVLAAASASATYVMAELAW